MKVNFNNLITKIDPKNIKKAVNIAKDVLRFGTYSITTAAFIYTYTNIQKQKTLEYKNAVKEADIELFNKINTQIETKQSNNELYIWRSAYNSINEPNQITHRNYFEGEQMLKDSISNSNK